MIKYDQLIQKHDPDKDRIGDCFRTSIACILEIKPAKVPHFVSNRYGTDDFNLVNIVNDVNKWLIKEGLFLQYMEFYKSTLHYDLSHFGHHVITAPSPRGNFHHCVVGFAGEFIHDPHKSRAGVDQSDDETVYGFFINRM